MGVALARTKHRSRRISQRKTVAGYGRRASGGEERNRHRKRVERGSSIDIAARAGAPGEAGQPPTRTGGAQRVDLGEAMDAVTAKLGSTNVAPRSSPNRS